MRTSQKVSCATKPRTTSLATKRLEAIGGSREGHSLCSVFSAQAFVVPAFVFPFSGATPGKDFVKKANGQPRPPASTSILSSMSQVESLLKEKDLRPGGSAENVKLDDKESQSGAAPGVATVAPPRLAAAYAPAGPGMSWARWLPRGPAGFPI